LELLVEVPRVTRLSIELHADFLFVYLH
jgi:hypothetical protein